MAHQFQGMVLVDGEWVSRTSDVFRAMDGARRQPDVEMKEPEVEPEHQIPQLGVASRTVFSNPVVRFILPANIRQRRLNDVVFVGEDSVHLKEIRAYGHLSHAASKSDFRGRILAARVFGERRRYETPHGTPLGKTSAGRGPGSTPMDEDRPLDQVGARNADTLQNGGSDNLPPQVIVLTLSSRLVMFLWAQTTQAGTVRFRQQTVRLPAATSGYETPGSFLAVDPRCRAVAVSAPEGRFMMYKMKAWDKWRADVRAGQNAAPIEEELMIALKGRVMHMEFLSPGSAGGAGKDDTHVILLFVLVHNGRTKLSCYDWDANTPLTNVRCRAKNVAVESADHNPSLLVPLSNGPEFLLVSSRRITKYKNILSGDPKPIDSTIPNHILRTDHPADSKCPPLWVQWERVPRHGPTEAFYIAREDGKILYLDIGRIGEMSLSEAGKWPHPIDQAFASLVVEHEAGKALLNPDVLIAAGTTSNGQVCKIGAWMEEYTLGMSFLATNSLAFVESIPNWAPIMDLCVTGLPGIRDPGQRASIFVANGRAPHGTVSELRHGLNALVDDFSEGMSGCAGLWALGQGARLAEEDYPHYALLIVSIPPETFVFKIVHVEGEWGMVQVPGEAEDGKISTTAQDAVCRNEETLVASRTSESTCVQITRSGARLFHMSDLTRADLVSFPTPALAAAAKPNVPLIAAAYREGSLTTLQVIPIRDGGAFAEGAKHRLPSEPTCLELMNISGKPYILFGTWEWTVKIFRYGEETGRGELELVASVQLQIRPLESSWCESAVVVASGSHQVLLCGMRNGYLVSYTIETDESGEFRLLPGRSVVIGPTAARVTTCATDPSAAFVACGADFCRVRITPKTSSDPVIDVDSIWFTHRQSPGIQQFPIAAVDQLPFTQGQRCGKDLGSLILAVSGDRLLYARLDYDRRWPGQETNQSFSEAGKAVPRRLETKATVRKVVYLEKLRKMIIATTETREERAPPDGYRSVRSAIRLVNMENDGTDPAIKQEDDVAAPKKSMIVGEFPLKNYELVYTLLDWVYVGADGKNYHFLIAGTGIPQRDGRDVGRRLFLQVSDTTIKLKKESSFDHAVRCMAFFGKNELLTISNRSLVYEEFQPAMQRWVERGRQSLPSAGVHLTCASPFIYVSTAQDSHICYTVVEDPDEPAKIKFHKMFTDGRQRLTAHHLNLQLDLPIPPPAAPTPFSSSLSSPSSHSPTQHTLILVSDKTCSLVGLYQPPHRTQQSAAPTLFEANLPRSITRLQRGDVRPRWRRPEYYKPKAPPGLNQMQDFANGYSSRGHGSAIPGVFADDIVGTCSDGTVYALSILSAPALKVLKILQNLAEVVMRREWDASLCRIRAPDLDEDGDDEIVDDEDEDEAMHTSASDSDSSDSDKHRRHPRIKARDIDPEYQSRGAGAGSGSGSGRARAWYVDGDVVVRFLETRHLKTFLQEEADEDVAVLLVDGFKELGEIPERLEEQGRAVDQMVRVEKWVLDVLGPVL